MADFKEKTLIIYSLLGTSPRLITSTLIFIYALILTLLGTYIINALIILPIFLSGITSFLSLFILSTLFTPVFIKRKNTKNYAALSTITSSGILLFLFIALLTTQRILIVGLPLIFLFSYIYIAVFSDAHPLKKILICFIQPTVSFILFFQLMPPVHLTLLYLVNIVILTIGIRMVEKTLDAPMLQLINVSWMDGGRIMLSSIMNGRFFIEEKNPNLGEKTEVPIKLLQFNETMIICPMLHPGPFGELGGSRMPSIFQNALPQVTFTPHTPTTHDFNPINKKELNHVIHAVSKASFSHYKTGSKLIKKKDTPHQITVYIHVFGEKNPVAFVALELLGRYCDISVELWEVTRQIAKGIGYKDVHMIDAHNYYTDDETSARLGTHIGSITKELITEALKQGSTAEQYPIGFASIKKQVPFDEDDGFGRDGIGVFGFQTDGETTLYLYLDGNSILPETKELFSTLLLKHCDHGMVITTDTHAVHTMGGGHNPLGKHLDENKITNIIRDMLAELQFKEVTAEIADITANVWIWSPDLGTRYIQAVYTTIVSAKYYIPSILGLTIFCLALVTFLL